MPKPCSILLVVLCAGLSGGFARAGTVALDFEGFADDTALTNQYSGFLFTNTRIWTAGLSLNELEFPPHSGVNAAIGASAPITISFSAPVLSFSGLTLSAFDSLNQGVGTANSTFGANFVSTGNPANELLQVSFSGGISRVSIAGGSSGSSFALDDVTVTTPVSASVPEPSSGWIVLSGFVLACILGRR